jgi:hypothetical protein
VGHAVLVCTCHYLVQEDTARKVELLQDFYEAASPTFLQYLACRNSLLVFCRSAVVTCSTARTENNNDLCRQHLVGHVLCDDVAMWWWCGGFVVVVVVAVGYATNLATALVQPTPVGPWVFVFFCALAPPSPIVLVVQAFWFFFTCAPTSCFASFFSQACPPCRT